MYRHFLVGAALLLSATTAGFAINAAAGESGFTTALHHVRRAAVEAVAGEDRPTLLAREDRRHVDHEDRLARRDRRHHDDDDDDDEGGGQAMTPQSGPANPDAPVPDNGLFNGNSRPKVQVR